MSRILSNPALKDRKEIELNEEWTNFTQRIGEVSGLIRDMASGDTEKSNAASLRADQILKGKIFSDENIKMKVKDDRTIINKQAFRSSEQKDGELDKETWMAEVSKDVERRALDRKIRQEKADTFKTQATKAFRRGEYDQALSYYNRALEQVKDNPMLYCDRALTNIKLGNFEKVFKDCEWALRLNENSFKARLYTAKAHHELEETDKFNECQNELYEKFPQHKELINYFLNKKEFDQDEEN